MKKIIKLHIKTPNNTVVIDKNAADGYIYNGYYDSYYEVFTEMLYYNRNIYKKIEIKNFTKIPADLLQALVNQYLHGAEIVFNFPLIELTKSYKRKLPENYYTYQWETLDLKAPVPKTLAEFTFTYNNAKTTYLDAIQSLNTIYYLPNEIWNALDVYSQKQIERCRKLNYGNYSVAEDWFKELVKDLTPYGISVYSPNPKTQYEAKAETQFEKACASYKLRPDETALTDEQLIFLRKYAPAYGIEIPKFQFRINTREVKRNDKSYGYTAEPEIVTNVSLYDSRQKYDKDAKRRPNLPKDIRYGLRVREVENDKLLYDAYTQLMWVIENLKDDGLVPGYRRCPECGQIYREYDGCECGACTPIEFIPADNLFYGIASTYEDWDSTNSVTDTLI